MANYKQHLSGGIATGAICAGAPMFISSLSFNMSPLAFILAVVGGILPDIDSDHSTPVQIIFGYLGLIFPIIFINLFLENPTFEKMLLCSIFGYLIIHEVFARIFFTLTKHRGAIHSIPMGLIISLITYLAFYESNSSARLLYALAILLGYITHLVLDEIFAVDITGARLKSSFGTALKLNGGSKVKTMLLYTCICLLFVLVILI